MISQIPFSIPETFSSGLLDGSVVRIGSLLKETATGRIVAHVQETGLAQQALGLIKFPFSPLDAISSASIIYTNQQINQLSIMVQSLQMLQYANMGAALAGIGVSVAGFAMIKGRLKAIDADITGLAESMKQSFQDLLDRDLRKHFSHVYVLFDKAECSLALSNPTNELIGVAFQLTDESGFFLDEIIYLLKKEQFDAELFSSLVRALALCNAGRLECLLLANELAAARQAAGMTARDYQKLFDGLIPTDLARKQIDRSNESNYTRFREIQLQMKQLVQGLRDMTEVALTKPYLIESLMEQKINGRDYIVSLREEKNHPLLLLQHRAV